MRRVAARIAIACALAVLLGACRSFRDYVGLRTDEAGWKEAGDPAAAALTWRAGDVSLLVAAEFEPVALPVTLAVTNRSADELRVAVARAAAANGTATGTWRIEGSEEPPQTYAYGTEIVVPGSSDGAGQSTLVLSLPADRAWTAEAPVALRDTISYDLTFSRGVGEVRPLRFEVVHVGDDFRWWQPLVLGGVAALVVAYPETSLHVFLSTAH